MNSLEDLRYTSSFTKKYWCHICKKEFSKLGEHLKKLI